MKKNTVLVEQIDPETNQIRNRGRAEFVSWNQGLLTLQFENDAFTFEPDMGHFG